MFQPQQPSFLDRVKNKANEFKNKANAAAGDLLDKGKISVEALKNNIQTGVNAAKNNVAATANNIKSSASNFTDKNKPMFGLGGGDKLKHPSKKGGFYRAPPLGVSYYATSVHNMQTAQPSYWLKGGSKSTRRYKNKKRTRRHNKGRKVTRRR